ncbi:MAG: Asp-tRNA(Asn)/Glu-tRNA(Gln) amidotransferase subunit GatB [candidate division WOR-3 bacterium]|nr:Asp-tRNA(Asn)/Glu-tRNA(Gln) amidotransferase subunit GatB [candidate division WOR-3 bacterium]
MLNPITNQIIDCKYEVIIGLEVHIQLKTKSKCFCSCPVEFGGLPNTNVCPICLGLPGTLPVLNHKAVELAVRAGLALNCQIAQKSSFARKHYFYPDLPKGYQITQYKEPLAINGFIDVNGSKIRIRRLHLEEDSGKSMHCGNETLVDFNRCGVPLIEVVTEPDIRSPEQTVQVLQMLRQILQYLDVSDCDMEKGHFRCEPNISLRRVGETKLGVRTELKNLNSLRSVREGLQFEIERQKKILDNNGIVVQETLYWDEQSKTAGPMRGKEESEDYRYFPEPDLPVLVIEESEIESIKRSLPLMPWQRKAILLKDYNLPESIAEIIVETKEFADYFDAMLKEINDAQLVANWLVTEVRAVLNEKRIEIQEFSVTPHKLVQLLKMLKEEKISNRVAKDIFNEMIATNKSALEIVSSKDLTLVDDENLLFNAVREVLDENPDVVAKYKAGKTTVISYLIGQVQKKTKGKLKPQKIQEAIQKQLQ